MILAAPLVIPFAEIIGVSIAALGMSKATDEVNKYIEANPEQSMKIFQMIMPSQGIANILKNKSSDEEVEEDVEVEEVDTRDLTRAEKAKMMKELAKSGGGNMREKMKKGYEEIIQPGESDRELDDAEDRYDGGVEDAPKPKFDYKKFFKNRYADGGAIGIEVLFEEKKPRQGLFMGGPALTGQPLAIYNSMSAYNSFTDQEIANAIKEAGYSLPTADSGTTPPGSTPGNNLGYQGESDNFSPYNPDPNTIRSVRTDPRIAAANEADVRTKQLTSMGINDPFANEASLSGAYYGDMPEDTSNQIGKQSMFAKAKQGLTGLMDNPLVNLISSSTPFGMAKNLFKGIGSKMPVNQRAIQEDIMGNLGFAVNDIGQIVSTGDYDDESGDNVMAGYNLNRMTVDTFKNRIDKIRNRKAAQTASSIARIAAIQEAQRKFELGEKLKADALLEAQLKKAQKEIEAKGYKDYGQGGASQATQDSYAGSDGSYAGASTQDYGGGEKDGGIIGYRNGGLATMFKEKR